ncbi:MAG: toll/interleukin-1 receptor domain-containing protein [Steroidobacteraceae bacterium]
MSADIFISFASQDAKIATTICKAIENRGFTCWIATRDILPGENFQSSIVRAIRGAKVLLLVFTANSNRSDEMTKELALASQQKLMVVPLRVENVTPSDAFAYEFATRQWIDLFSDWEQAMGHLGSRLTAALADDRSHTDTIVLGKPVLADPAMKKAVVVRRRRAGMAVMAASVAVIAGVVVTRQVSRTDATLRAADAVAVVEEAVLPAADAAVPAEATAGVAAAPPAALPVPAAASPAAPLEEKPKPKPKPRPAANTNLPY